MDARPYARPVMLRATRRDWAAVGILAVLNVLIFARLWTALTDEGKPLALIPWDFVSAYAPFLILIGDALKEGTLPLWNPYVAGGMPFFVYPQSQMLAPPTLLVGSVFGYTAGIAQIQQLVTVWFGGVGAYVLSRSIWSSRWSGLITGIAFEFTTAVFGNFQHMTIVNTFALMPWLFWSVRASAAAQAPASPYWISLFLLLLITMGYPGVQLMVVLWSGIYALYLAYMMERSRRGPFVRSQLEAWMVGVALAAVAWLPIALHLGTFTRGDGLDIDYVLGPIHSMSFKHLWGPIFHFMASYTLPGSDIDMSMRGIYFGLVAVGLGILGLRACSRETKPLLVMGTVTFLMSFGGTFFGRTALHVFVPIFNFSRFPSSDSRTLAVLAFCLMAGGGARVLLRERSDDRRFFQQVCLGLCAVVAFGMWLWKDLMGPADYSETFISYGSLELLTLSGLLLASRHGLPAPQVLGIAAALLSFEVGTSVVANQRLGAQPVSDEVWRRLEGVHKREFTPHAAKRPRIAIPGDHGLISEVAAAGYITKNFYLSDYNHFRLKSFELLIARGFREWMQSGPRLVALPPGAAPTHFAEFQQVAQPVAFDISRYAPNRVTYQLRLPTESLVVFNEMFYPGWQARIDDGPSEPMVELAGGLRALKVPAGQHQIRSTFRPSTFYLGLGVSAAALAFLVLRLSMRARSTRRLRLSVRGNDVLPA
jgi:hypothetical protein